MPRKPPPGNAESRRRDLNSQPQLYESCALPLSYVGQTDPYSNAARPACKPPIRPKNHAPPTRPPGNIKPQNAKSKMPRGPSSAHFDLCFLILSLISPLPPADTSARRKHPRLAPRDRLLISVWLDHSCASRAAEGQSYAPFCLSNEASTMEIMSHAQLQEARKLPFCYLCGRRFGDKERPTRDHVPPKAIFLPCDRTKPLILPTHARCNQKESTTDEIIGQLIYALHHIYPPRGKLRLKVNMYENPENQRPVLALEGINLKGVITRCVKAFHGALYKTYLPRKTHNWVDPPTAVGVKRGNKVAFEEPRIQFPLFVSIIKKNREAGKIDRISCFNDRCVYECVWEQMDDGRWACIFALNIYDWKNLGDPRHQQQRGCVGFYMPKRGLPENATTGIARLIEIPVSNLDIFDPFGT